jgi:fluoride exporter
MKWWSLAVGSLAGGFSRYLVAGVVYDLAGTRFPYGTLAVNVSGCFLIGLLNALAEAKFLIGPQGRLLLMTGFCGAYTTFSTLLLETSNLAKDGEMARATLNVVMSLGAGFVMFRLGEWLGVHL